MATVYLGEQTALQRKIVVKFLNKDISDDDEIRERFILEARTPARLKHPNIVEVIDEGLAMIDLIILWNTHPVVLLQISKKIP